MKLITIPYSHFCEKARWGLDRARLPYVEKGYAPVLHLLAVMPRGSRSSPVLVDRGRVVRGSSAILRLCDAHGHAAVPLYPEDSATRHEVEKLVARYDIELGPATRLWLYSWALDDHEQLMRLISVGLSPGQRWRLRRMLPAVARTLRRVLGVGPGTHARSALRVDEELALVSERLSDGRPYLAGGRFTAADLTFAALAAPVLMPPTYGGGAITPPSEPPGLAGEIARWRETPAGRHVMAIYRDLRVGA
jgi:glutathione S-transferase